MKRIGAVTLIEVLVILLVAIGIFSGLQLMELRAEEPRRAVIAMEMIHGRNYIVPKIFNYNYYNKPPLFNWVLVLFFSITGSFNEMWVRLPSILSLFLTAFLVFKVTARYINRQAGILAALLLLTAADILFYGSVDAGEIDLFLMVIICVQAIAVFHYSLRQNWWALFAISYIFMAAGILTKGLPLALIQALLLLCWFIYIKQFKKLFSIPHFVSMVIGFGLVYLYFALYSRQSDVVLYLSQLLTESTQRSMLENKWSGILLNMLQSPLQILYIGLPATGLLLYAINKKVRSLVKEDQLFAFSFIFSLIICITFFISPETANRYLYPAFPFIVIMAAIIYSKATEVLSSSKWLLRYKGVLIVFIFLAVARIAYDVWGMPYQQKTSPRNYRALASEILQHSHGQPVYLTGHPQVNTIHSLPFFKLPAMEVKGPPLLPFQIPYYINKATGVVMRYDSIPQPGTFYLTPVDFIKDKKAVVYFTFFDNWIRRDVALVKF